MDDDALHEAMRIHEYNRIRKVVSPDGFTTLQRFAEEQSVSLRTIQRHVKKRGVAAYRRNGTRANLYKMNELLAEWEPPGAVDHDSPPPGKIISYAEASAAVNRSIRTIHRWEAAGLVREWFLSGGGKGVSELDVLAAAKSTTRRSD